MKKTNKQVNTTLRIPQSVYDKIIKEAKKRGISVNAYICNFLYEKD